MKRLFQIRLRTFMALTMATCLFVGWLATNYHQHQRELSAIESLGNRFKMVADNAVASNPSPVLLIS